MISRLRLLAGLAIVFASLGVTAAGQGTAPATTPAKPAQDTAPPRPAPKPIVPVRVQIAISRFDGDKKTSSLPYVLSVDVNGRPTTLNMGIRVPVVQTTFSQQSGPATSYNYQNVGTNISCSGSTTDSGAFELSLTVDDSSLYDKTSAGNDKTAVPAPIIQSFNTSTNLTLRDGQTQEFTMATDKVSGQVVKVAVTLSVIK